MNKNTFITNLKINKKSIQILVIIITSSILIKFMALFNRIILNRSLGINGTSLYTIVIPSIMLFVSLGSLSLSTSINQLVAKEKNKYNKKILTNGLIIALISSSISSLILLIIIKPLTNNWINSPHAIYPILSSVPLIYFSSISSVLRGIYNGLTKIITSYISIIIEQIVRIFTQIIFIQLINDITIAVTFAIISMSFGEIASIIYLLFRIKSISSYNDNNDMITKQILSSSLPNSITHLISSFSCFLEPIIITFIFTYLNYNNEIIKLDYSEITSFIIPTITMFIFVSSALNPLIIQKTSFYFNQNNKFKIYNLINRLIIFISIITFFILTILYFYGNDLINLLYNINLSNNIVSKYVYLFIFLYIESPLIAIIQGINKNKSLLIIVIISSLIKLILLIIIPLFLSKYFDTASILKETLMISNIISFIFFTLSLYKIINKKLDFKIEFKNLVIILIYMLFIYLFIYLINIFNINLYIKLLFDSIFFSLTFIYLSKSIVSNI